MYGHIDKDDLRPPSDNGYGLFDLAFGLPAGRTEPVGEDIDFDGAVLVPQKDIGPALPRLTFLCADIGKTETA